ncbi:MAG: hypothetical protein H6836_07545 [Planctomycetes bacterium]|nr:hypothetical protein [Planctomycetota bacterium]MCB9889418.1 hypothetical protein [Planctomycetota bacterium]
MQGFAVAGPVLSTLCRDRAAVRLGEAAFGPGHIGEALLDQVVAAFTAFADAFARVGIAAPAVTAVATSAMRAATNRTELVGRVRAATGIELTVIHGDHEAALLADAVRSALDLADRRGLLLDLGGGSVEVVVAAPDATRGASFELGALRLLAGAAPHEHGLAFLAALERQVAAEGAAIRHHVGDACDVLVAVGGSLQRIAEHLGTPAAEGRPAVIPLPRLEAWTRETAARPTAERVSRLGLEPDRADTVVPAAVVVLALGRWAGLDAVTVPKVDLRDGIAFRRQRGLAMPWLQNG